MDTVQYGVIPVGEDGWRENKDHGPGEHWRTTYTRGRPLSHVRLYHEANNMLPSRCRPNERPRRPLGLGRMENYDKHKRTPGTYVRLSIALWL